MESKLIFKKNIKYLLTTLILLIVVTLFLCTKMPIIDSFRIVFGLVYILFLPGFIWSFVFWQRSEIIFIERLVFSVIISIIITPLIIFMFDKIGFAINKMNLILEVMGIIILGIIILFFKNNKLKKEQFNE